MHLTGPIKKYQAVNHTSPFFLLTRRKGTLHPITIEATHMDLTTKLYRNPNSLSSTIDDDLVIFSAKNGMYYGTQIVGSRIWSLIENEMTVARICEQLMQEFEVDRDICEHEVLAFLQQLHSDGLVNTR